MPAVLYRKVSVDAPKFLECLQTQKPGYVFGSITITDGPDADEGGFDWEYLLQLSMCRYDDKTIKIAFCVPTFSGGDRWLRLRLRIKNSDNEELYVGCTESARLIRECETEETVLLVAKGDINLKTLQMKTTVVFHFELLIWRQNPHVSDMKPASRKVEIMQRELRNPKFYDRILLVEGRELRICTLPLICQSRSDQLVGALEDSRDPTVALNGFEYDVMRALMHFCYTETFPPPADIFELSPTNVLKLLLAADKLLVKGLIDECVQYLVHQDLEGQPFSVLADALWIGIYKGQPKLLGACLARLQWNFEKVSNSYDWILLKQTDKHFYFAILSKLKDAEFEL